LLLFGLLVARPAAATDNHAYKPDEYAVISGGRSPDGHWDVVAHGEGEYGDDNFDLYLIDESAHGTPIPLHISDYLDTAPLSLVALWAPDSAHVAILNRIDRHVLSLHLFGIADGKVQSIDVPLLSKFVGERYFNSGVNYEVLGRLYRFSWEKPDRFALEEWDTFDAPKPVFSKGIETYVTLEQQGPERTFTNFSAQAMCEISKKNELSVLSIKPQPNWPETIIYSPHLLYDRQNGLHSTETTLSSVGK
jgi:hypothetical protein